MAEPNLVNLEGLVDHLAALLKRRFSSRVSDVYFGDIGVYPPRAFGGSRDEQKAVIALSPDYSYLEKDNRVAAYENRLIGVVVIVMVNLIPFFEASPKEAFGERMLVGVTTDVANFLTQEENVTLGGRIQHSKVGDIDFSWMQRKSQSIRAAGIQYEARIRVPRM